MYTTTKKRTTFTIRDQSIWLQKTSLPAIQENNYRDLVASYIVLIMIMIKNGIVV